MFVGRWFLYAYYSAEGMFVFSIAAFQMLPKILSVLLIDRLLYRHEGVKSLVYSDMIQPAGVITAHLCISVLFLKAPLIIPDWQTPPVGGLMEVALSNQSKVMHLPPQ